MESTRQHWFKNISIAKKLYFAVGVMALLIAIELATLLFSISTLSSVRAFVGAEGLWSKAQKDAIYHLRKYARSGKAEDYTDFLHFMKVPLGDRKTRIEMGKENPDILVMRNGFIEGRNHPDDVDGMIKLFQRFHSISYINKAIRIWSEADSIITQMQITAEKLHASISVSGINASQTEENLKQVNDINKKLTVLEDEFSFTLGEGSRWLENLILKILLLIALTVEISGLWLSISISRNISKGINEIIRVSKEVSEGNLNTRSTIYSNDEIGQLAGYFNSMINKLDEKIVALSESEEKFYSIFHSSSIGMTISGFSDKKFIEANQKFLSSLGYTKEEVIGKTSLELGITNNVDRRNEVLKIVNEKGPTPDYELELKCKSGEIIDSLISVTVMKINGEQCVVTIFYDITEKKQTEIALQKKTLELSQINKELEHFAHISSHDLQEPLRTVSNYMQVFEEDYAEQLDDNARKYIKSINNATKRMSKLVKALLDYSRLGRNKNLVHVSCKNLIDEVLADLNSIIESSKAVIEVSEMPLLNVYEIEMRQLVQNLITNAIKFRQKGTQPKIQIAASLVNNQWLFSVSDNGIGIQEEHLNRIFDIFHRLHNSEEYEGSGIGLSNCKKIVELHQGEIWVESTFGKGTTFKFTIPQLEL